MDYLSSNKSADVITESNLILVKTKLVWALGIRNDPLL
jgi:hypothetical protein